MFVLNWKQVSGLKVDWHKAAYRTPAGRGEMFLPAVGVVCLLISAAACTTHGNTPEPASTPALRGQALAEDLGCFGCHGTQGIQGVVDPAAPGGRVPGWDFRTVEMYVASEQDIREWILYGRARGDVENGVPPAGEYLVPMPAYEEYLNNDQLEDLVAYFRAVSGWNPDIPDPVYEGRKLAVKLGCFSCHGPSGMGGVANPGSYRGFLVPWDSPEFSSLAANDQEIRDWILFGQMPERLAGSAMGTALGRQALRMPPYRAYLSDADIEKIIFYINWLRGTSTWEEEKVHVIG